MDQAWSKLERAWAGSDEFFSSRLLPAAMLRRPIELRNPFVFYLGHLPAFAWNTVRKQLSDQPHIDRAFEVDIFERGMDPEVLDPTNCHRHSVPPGQYPSVEAVQAYIYRVRSAMRSLDQITTHTIDTVAEHEFMHIETLMYMLVALQPEFKMELAGNHTLALSESELHTSQRVTIPTGTATLGAPISAKHYGWDNEFGQVSIHVPQFQVDSLPVTVGQFRLFVDAGGYLQDALWKDDDLVWRRRNNVRFPQSWGPNGRTFSTSQYTIPISEAERLPVFVSLAEARAYANWTQSRLPTEAEWHRCAYGRVEGGEHTQFPWLCSSGKETDYPPANVGMRNSQPVAVGAFEANVSEFGVRDLIGDGWELCDTVFAPFEGFKPQQNYQEYSADFFDGKHFVLKGGSWATDKSLVRRSFRNFYQAQYPHVFAKFRTVAV